MCINASPRLSQAAFTALTACQTQIASVARAPWPVPQDAKVALVNGYPLTYTDTGSGAPVVLVHGALNDYRVWAAQVQELSGRYRVIALSLRHYYPEKWDGNGAGFTILEQSEDVVQLVKTLNLGRVHLLGHSRGGTVVLAVATRHPEIIRTLILEDPGGTEALLPQTPESAKLATQAAELNGKLRQRLVAGQAEVGAEEFIDTLGGPGTWAKRSRSQQQLVLDNIGTGIGDSKAPALTCAEVQRFNFPVLFITAERSPKRSRRVWLPCERAVRSYLTRS